MSDTRQLEERILYHDKRYWLDGEAEISDEAYDLLVERLTRLDPRSPVLNRVGAYERTGADVEHRPPMLSLDKCYDEAALRRWWGNCVGDAHVVTMPKLDGLAGELEYDGHGRFVRASTRGDGLVGEDITATAALAEGVPPRVSCAHYDIDSSSQVRGEFVIPCYHHDSPVFQDFANARNAVAGIMRRKSQSVRVQHLVHFVAYDAIGLEGVQGTSGLLGLLKELGFRVVDSVSAPADVGQMRRMAAAWAADRENGNFELEYEIDGVVFRVDDLQLQKELGATSHHPRHSIAWKFQSKTGASTLRGVVWQTARSGKITPVAVIDPVELAGAEVTGPTLHNWKRFMDLDLHVGDVLSVSRRGDVIPQVEENMGGGAAAQKFSFPVVCPSCGNHTRIDSPLLMCSDPAQCGAAVVQRLVHWCKTLDLDGWGVKVLEQLHDAGVMTPADLYELGMEDLTRLDRVGEKKAINLLDMLHGNSAVGVHTFLAALGIPGVGKSVALRIASQFPEEIMRGESPERNALLAVDGVGPETVDSLSYWFWENQAYLESIFEHVTVHGIPEESAPLPVGPLTGKTVCFTGKLTGKTKGEATKMVERLGGQVVDSVTKDLSLLVVGGETTRVTSKLEKARRLSVEFMDEPAFWGKYWRPNE